MSLRGVYGTFEGGAINRDLTIGSGGELGVGVANPLHALHVRAVESIIALEVYDGSSAEVGLRLKRSNSSTVGVHQDVTNNAALGEIGFFGSGAGAFRLGARIFAEAQETFTAASAATELLFQTTPVGSVIPVTRMSISPSGKAIVFATAAGGALEVVGPQAGVVGGFAAGELQIRSSDTSAFAGAVITGHNSSGGDGKSQVWYFGSISNSNANIALINRTTSGTLEFWTQNTQRLSISNGGNLTINKFTKLGSDAPLVKMKRVMLNLGSAASLTTTKAHGLTASKILSITGHVTATDNQGYPAQYETFDGLQNFKFAMTFDGTNVILRNDDSSTALIWGQAVEILIIYVL